MTHSSPAISPVRLQQIRDPQALLGVGMPGELENRRCDWQMSLMGGHSGQPLGAAHGRGQVLVELRRQIRFVIEGVELRRGPFHVEVNDPFRLRCEVRQPRQAARAGADWSAAMSWRNAVLPRNARPPAAALLSSWRRFRLSQ